MIGEVHTNEASNSETILKGNSECNDDSQRNGNSNESSSSDHIASAYSTPFSSSEKLNIPEAMTRHQEKLKDGAKIRIKGKFDELEKETGVKLRRYWSELENDEEKVRENDSPEDSDASSSREDVKEKNIKINKTGEIEILKENLAKIQNQLRIKDLEIAKLSRIRSQVEIELEDLTASLFEEANKMIRTEYEKKEKCERDYKEAVMKLSVLEAEVKALKILVITSTPSTPNIRNYPHLDQSKNSQSNFDNSVKADPSTSWKTKYSPFNRASQTKSKPNSHNGTPKKSPSNYELGSSLNLLYESNGVVCDLGPQFSSTSSIGEVDPVFHQQFFEWKKNPSLEKSTGFINSIYELEVYPVFNFKNRELSESVLAAIEDNSIAIEAVSDKSSFPKKCALLDIPRTCKYRMKLGDNWYYISSLCRNRIIAVCDLFCYLRYIQRGLVKSPFQDVYWEIMQKRRNIALARLGFACS